MQTTTALIVIVLHYCQVGTKNQRDVLRRRLKRNLQRRYGLSPGEFRVHLKEKPLEMPGFEGAVYYEPQTQGGKALLISDDLTKSGLKWLHDRGFDGPYTSSSTIHPYLDVPSSALA